MFYYDLKHLCSSLKLSITIFACHTLFYSNRILRNENAMYVISNCAHMHARTHTHTHLYLYYHCQIWLCGPHLGGEPAEGNKTGGPVGSRDTSLIFPVAWPPQCTRGTHLWACKTHEMREVGMALSDGIRIFVLDSWT